MKRFMAIRGTDKGTVGFEVELGVDHKLIRRMPDGELVIVFEGNLIEVTPEVDNAIMGLTPEQRIAVCDEMSEE